VRLLKNHADRPVLITEAPVNADDELAWRRKRYLIMMAIRAACIIGAASTFRISGRLAAAFVAAALVLPWTAVVMANDRLPKAGVRFLRFHGRAPRADRQLGSPGPAELPGATELPGDSEPPDRTVIDL
jgi:hypothetical protein